MMTMIEKFLHSSLAIAAACLLVGCEYDSPEPGGATTGGSSENGSTYVIQVAGSSTVFPVSTRVAESFEDATQLRVTVDSTGTGTGMERLANKECDVTGASRPMKDSEKEACEANGVDSLPLKIGMDGISIVVNPENDWCQNLTVGQLKKLWEHGSTITTWKQLDESWPDEKIKLFGPDDKSGTFDYFNEEIIGEVPEGQSPCREDYTPAVQDTVLVEGVKGDKYALGYFGFAYYIANADALKLVGVSASEDAAEGVQPTEATIESGEYAPLSRPLFIYVNKESLKTKPEVAQFVQYYLGDGQEAVSKVGYVKVPQATIDAAKAEVDAVLGSE